jgi:outer membrane lipoprotein-sorting protein
LEASLKILSGILLTFFLCYGASALADTPSAESILKKSLEKYDAVKTYQGVIVFKIENGPTRNTITLAAKARNGSNGMIAQSVLTVTTVAMTASGTTTKTLQTVDDGSNTFYVYPDLKQYVKQTHSPDTISGLFRESLDRVQKFGGKFTVTVKNMNGRQFYVLTGSPKNATLVILVDKASFHLKSIRLARGTGAERVVSETTVGKELVDQPLPPSLFKWTPPAGYKEQTAAKPGTP